MVTRVTGQSHQLPRTLPEPATLEPIVDKELRERYPGSETQYLCVLLLALSGTAFPFTTPPPPPPWVLAASPQGSSFHFSFFLLLPRLRRVVAFYSCHFWITTVLLLAYEFSQPTLKKETTTHSSILA